MGTAAVRLPTRAQIARLPLVTKIAAFLRVENRVPLTPEQRARLDERMRRVNDGDAARVDYRKPKGMSWEEWDRIEADRAAAKRAASYERIEELRGRGVIPPAKPRPERGGPGYKGHIAGSRKALVHEKYDQDGADAARALGAELGLKDGTVKSWIGGWSKGS